MNFKKIFLFSCFTVLALLMIGCTNESQRIENQLREDVEGTWVRFDSGGVITMLDFNDNWANDDTVLNHDVVFTMSQDTGSPSINFLYMRVYTEGEPVRITIFGHDVHNQEVAIFEEEPLTIRGDVLHLGDMTFYRQDSDALNENMLDSIRRN